MVYKNISNISPKQSGKTRHSRYINTLSQIAINVEPVAQARIAAGIVYRNNLISIGVNRSKTHPFQKRYCKNKDAIYLHAETDAIKNSINKIDLEKFSNSILYICRVKIYKKKFVFGLAKPCDGCMKAISTFNIKKVYYTLDNGGYDLL
jgi:deoxycytidylate deaminase